ncbi:MAG: FAD-dependent oxidoreductase, partial [Polyangiaceae bacterium]
MSTEKTDVLVVGGGLGGLVTAALVARRGLSVTVLERAKHVGGRAMTHVKQGFAFNEGAHALYRGGAAMRVLDSLGVEPPGRQPPPSGLAVAFGRAHTLPVSLGSMLATGLLPFGAKLQGAKLLARLGRFDTRALDDVTWDDFVAREVADPLMRFTLDAFVRVATYTNAGDVISAGATIDQLRIAQSPGVMYVDGGWSAIALAALRAATLAGAVVRTDAGVAAIEQRDGAWCATTKDGVVLAATTLVLATGPEAASRLLPSGALRVAAHRARPARIACLDVGLRTLPNPKATFALGVDQPLYFSVPSKTAAVAPDGCALVSTMKYLPLGEKPDSATDRADLEALLDLLQPGWRAHLVEERFLPSMIAANAVVGAADGGRA